MASAATPFINTMPGTPDSHPGVCTPSVITHNKPDGSICRVSGCPVCILRQSPIAFSRSGTIVNCCVCKCKISSVDDISAYFIQSPVTAVAGPSAICRGVTDISVRCHTKGMEVVNSIIMSAPEVLERGDYARLFCICKIATYVINDLALISGELARFNSTTKSLTTLDMRDIKTMHLIVATSDSALKYLVAKLASFTATRHLPAQFADPAECRLICSIDAYFYPINEPLPPPGSRAYNTWALENPTGCHHTKMASVAAEIKGLVPDLSPFLADSFSAVADLALFHVKLAQACPADIEITSVHPAPMSS